MIVLKALFELSSRQLQTALAADRGGMPSRWESHWHAVWSPPVAANAWHVMQPASWPASIKLRGKKSVFHRLHVPGLVDAYQRDLLLWVYLRRVWTNERLFVKLKKGSPGCLVCGAGLATESLRHLIWDCPAVREGWKTVLHLFADLRGLARPVLEAAGDWSTSRFVVSVLGTTPEWPVSAVPASEQQSLIWLVLKAELLSWVWRLRCKLIQQPGPGAPAAAAAPLPHSGADVVRMLQSVLRQRVLEERYFPTNGLVFEDWVARGALGRVDGGLGGAITFSPLLGG